MATRNIRLFLSIGLFCAATAVMPRSLAAQGSSMFNSSGVSRGGTGGISGTLGASGFGSLSSGSSSSMGALGSALGSAAGGRGATGASGFGATGTTGMTGITGMAGAGNSGFVGRTSTAMAGNARATQTGMNSSRSGTRSMMTNGGSGNFGQQQPQNASNSMKRSSAIRPRQRVAFEVNAKSPATVVAGATTRLDRISSKNPSLKQVGISLQGDQIVLSGKVKSASDSRLAEHLLRLEPGVRSVRNELQVEQQPTVE